MKLCKVQGKLIKVTHEFLSKNQQKWTINGGEKVNNVVEFHVANCFNFMYNCPPNKLAGLYRGPLIIAAINRPDIITAKDIITKKVIKVHARRLMGIEIPDVLWEIISLAAIVVTSFMLKILLIMRERARNQRSYYCIWLNIVFNMTSE